jgi:3-oxoacyl-[acyl-carrier-protein] synthase-3
MASAGSIFGLALAAQLAPVYGPILVVASEKMSDVIAREPLNRNTAFLLGDGAGASLVVAKAGAAEIRASALHSDGAFARDLTLDFDCPLHMNGQVVILQSSRKIPGAIQESLERAQVRAGAVDVFLMHQANRNLMDRVAKSVGVSPEKFYSNIERYGNTSSASMLIAAAEWSASRGFRPGAPVVFAGFGAGFHWGAVLAVGV